MAKSVSCHLILITTDHPSWLTFTLGAQVLPVLHHTVVQENQALVNGFEAISAGFNPLLHLESIYAKNIFKRSCTFSNSYE